MDGVESVYKFLVNDFLKTGTTEQNQAWLT